MNRRERLMRTLRGEPVDRPAVCFYEIDDYNQRPDDPDPYNIFNDPSWLPLLELARERSDRIVRQGVWFEDAPRDPLAELTRVERTEEGRSRVTRTTIRAGSRTLTSRSRRNADVDTVWEEEHLLKDADDLRGYLDLPVRPFGGRPDVARFLAAEKAVGDSGIVMIDTGDPICTAAALFDMGTYTVIAMTEPGLFTALLDRIASWCLPATEAVAKALPGRLWRICGSEYASPPYLPPSMYHDYVVRYDKSMVQSIQRYGGYARIHSHGRLREILDGIAQTGCDGLDPIEPPPQGDVELAYVRERYGKQMVLFANIEVSDIENLPNEQFAAKVDTALREGTSGTGRGFVLMPSACPYGRRLSATALANYRLMVEKAEGWR